MAIAVAGSQVELREVVLRDKPAAMVQASPKATVPVLVLPEGVVIDESLEVMQWALMQSDPEHWLAPDQTAAKALIADNDGPFKHHLDRFKYATRYEDADPEKSSKEHRTAAEPYLLALDDRLRHHPQLMGDTRSLADIAIFPFVRQFANAAGDFMQDDRFSALMRWFDGHVSSDLFVSVMKKYPQWRAGDPGVAFP